MLLAMLLLLLLLVLQLLLAFHRFPWCDESGEKRERREEMMNKPEINIEFFQIVAFHSQAIEDGDGKKVARVSHTVCWCWSYIMGMWIFEVIC